MRDTSGTPDHDLLVINKDGIALDAVPDSFIKLNDGQANGMDILTVKANNVSLRNLNLDSNMWGQTNGQSGWNDPPNGKSVTLGVMATAIHWKTLQSDTRKATASN